VNYNKNEILCTLIPREEETSALAVDLEEKDKEEAWAEVKVRSFVINEYNKVTWQGTIKKLVPIVVIATHLNMS
jgi:hypothetical protein